MTKSAICHAQESCKGCPLSVLKTNRPCEELTEVEVEILMKKLESESDSKDEEEENSESKNDENDCKED